MLSTLNSVCGRSVLAAGLMLSLTLPAIAGTNSNSCKKVRIADPDDVVNGLTYGEWGGRWGQQVQSIPVSRNPLTDTTGEWCGEGQLGSTWTIASFLDPGTVRHCTIPADKSLYVNILGFWCGNIGTSFTEEELRACASDGLDGFLEIADIYVEIDGEVVEDLLDYRDTSPLLYATLPEDNLYQYFGADAPAGTYSSFVMEQVGLLLNPLCPGDHTIRLFGTIFETEEFEFTTHLHVQG